MSNGWSRVAIHMDMQMHIVREAFDDDDELG